MSYEIVKKIRITEDKVLITSCPNNVWPKDYYESEYPSFSKILAEQGREAVEKEILIAYFKGLLEGSNRDRYQRTNYRIRTELTEDKHEIWRKCREDAGFEAAFKQRLYDNFKNPPKKQPCCLEREDGYRFRRITTRRYFYSKSKYKIFHNPAEATYVLKTYNLDKFGFRLVIL